MPSSKELFHGGAPGLQVGDRLRSAASLGHAYAYFDPAANYDPNSVYVTTDRDVAKAYAGRYVAPSGGESAGSVYRVRPVGPVRIDRDYSRRGEFRGVFLTCDTAEVIEVVETGVRLTVAEQIELERPYLVWGRADLPVYDDDGWIIPSEQMARNGVTREWTTMLRPWLRTSDVDAKGQLTIAAKSENPWAAFLDLIPSLDAKHQITPTSTGRLRCLVCGSSFDSKMAAARHQLGDRQMELISLIHGWDSPPTPPLAAEAARRSPARWDWL